MSLIFSVLFSFSIFRAAGLVSSGVTIKLAEILQQPTPIQRVNNVVLADAARPHLQITPSRVEIATAQDVEVLDAGYLHEHYFNAIGGGEYAVYVQFISITAKKVSRNVMIVDPQNGEARERCLTQRILDDDTNIAFICNIDMSGRWRVLILGRDQESVGAYFVGVERLDTGGF